jgi:hypothetical protein
VGNDLPDYQSEFVSASVEATSFRFGLDAAKPAAPAAGDIWLATDTDILYVCYVAGTWTKIDYRLFNAIQTDQTAARALDTTNNHIYQNTSGKIRQVNVTVQCVNGAYQQIEAYCQSTSPPTISVDIGNWNHLTSTGYVRVSFVVPPNYYYKVLAASGTLTLYKWIEWDLH